MSTTRIFKIVLAELAIVCLLLLQGATSQGNPSPEHQSAVPINLLGLQVRLAGGRNAREGRVEVSLDGGARWGTICSTFWSMREGNVVCRQLGYGSATLANMSTEFGNSQQNPWAIVATLCSGTEQRLADCFWESLFPPTCVASNRNVAVVRCA